MHTGTILIARVPIGALVPSHPPPPCPLPSSSLPVLRSLARSRRSGFGRGGPAIVSLNKAFRALLSSRGDDVPIVRGGNVPPISSSHSYTFISFIPSSSTSFIPHPPPPSRLDDSSSPLPPIVASDRPAPPAPCRRDARNRAQWHRPRPTLMGGDFGGREIGRTDALGRRGGPRGVCCQAMGRRPAGIIPQFVITIMAGCQRQQL